MSMTPQYRDYAKVRIERLRDKLEGLYAQSKTPETRKAIKSSQNALRRWELRLEGKI